MSPSILLEEFERVEAAPGKALLRVAARAPGGGIEPGAAALVVRGAGRVHRLAPLPAPPDQSGRFRAAYSAPVALLEAVTSYRLELPDGATVELPAPARRRHRVGRPPATLAAAAAPGTAPVTAPDARIRAIAELERRLEAERERGESAEAERACLAERIAALQERLADLVATTAETEAAAAAAREEAAARHVQIEAAQSDIGRQRERADLLERRAEQLEARLADARHQADANADRADRAEADAAHASARIDALEAEAVAAGAELERVVALHSELEAALAEQEERRAKLEREAADFAYGLASLAAEREALTEPVAMLSTEAAAGPGPGAGAHERDVLRLVDRLATVSDERAALSAQLEAVAAELRSARGAEEVHALREELALRRAEALEVARQFEQEAAARAEAELIAARLEAEHRELAARADELEARLAKTGGTPSGESEAGERRTASEPSRMTDGAAPKPSRTTSRRTRTRRK